jgi:hypothetical protein
MNRTELRQLAEDRVLDAKTLLDAARWSSASYLAGYAVECGLKACILARVERTGIIFVDKKFVEKCWTHDLEALVQAADLQPARGIAIGADPALGANWQYLKDWSEEARDQQKTEPEARNLYEAIADPTSGVLPWVRNHW